MYIQIFFYSSVFGITVFVFVTFYVIAIHGVRDIATSVPCWKVLCLQIVSFMSFLFILLLKVVCAISNILLW